MHIQTETYQQRNILRHIHTESKIARSWTQGGENIVSTLHVKFCFESTSRGNILYNADAIFCIWQHLFYNKAWHNQEEWESSLADEVWVVQVNLEKLFFFCMVAIHGTAINTYRNTHLGLSKINEDKIFLLTTERKGHIFW